MKWTVTLSTICAASIALAGCEATGDAGGDRTVDDASLPFTFEVSSEFTKAPIDQGDTRGDVVIGYGLSKLDVIAVRRVGQRALPGGLIRHVVQGTPVTSELRPALDGYAFECQYTAARAAKVQKACREAQRSLTRK